MQFRGPFRGVHDTPGLTRVQVFSSKTMQVEHHSSFIHFSGLNSLATFDAHKGYPIFRLLVSAQEENSAD